MTLSEYDLVHEDGSKEKVYLKPSENPKPSIKDHIMVTYFIVGIVALALSGYVTYKRIKK